MSKMKLKGGSSSGNVKGNPLACTRTTAPPVPDRSMTVTRTPVDGDAKRGSTAPNYNGAKLGPRRVA
jgi:hypothetical protein